MQPNSALVFAAGFGTRMRHLTKETPKPLIQLMGKPMIDHALSILSDAGIKSIYVNTHYFADQLEDHLSSFPFVTPVREEPNILETGGGLKNALPLIGAAPVFTVTCDTIWFGENPATQLADAWNPDTMDGLMLLIPAPDTMGYSGNGDFFLRDQNQLCWRGAHKTAPYIYSGIQIIKTDLLQEITESSFPIKLLWDKMITQGRLCGAIYSGKWADVGNPEGIALAERHAADV